MGNNFSNIEFNDGLGSASVIAMFAGNNFSILNNHFVNNTNGLGGQFYSIFSEKLRNSTISGNVIFDNLIYNNTLYNHIGVAHSIHTTGSNNTYRANNISKPDLGIHIDGGMGNYIEDNFIHNHTYGIYLTGNSGGNVILNNNISSILDHTLEDTTGNSYVNYLIYNNSHGQIKWIDEVNNGFAKNLTFRGNISLGVEIVIGNNSINFTLGGFSVGAINSSVNITLY